MIAELLDPARRRARGDQRPREGPRGMSAPRQGDGGRQRAGPEGDDCQCDHDHPPPDGARIIVSQVGWVEVVVPPLAQRSRLRLRRVAGAGGLAARAHRR